MADVGRLRFASVLTRLWICSNEILASSIAMSKPRPGARRSSVRTPVDAMNVLDGTQSHSTQAPPMPSAVDDGDVGDLAPASGRDERRLVACGAAADDHDAGCHGPNASQARRRPPNSLAPALFNHWVKP